MDETPTPNPIMNPSEPQPNAELQQNKVEKASKRKETLKRLLLVSGIAYAGMLFLIVIWALFVAELNLDFFRVFPFSQTAFNRFLFQLMNVMLGILTAASLLISTFWLMKMSMSKKDDAMKKKQSKKRMLMWGGASLLLAFVWLMALIFLGPKLIPEERFSSPILTDPRVTLGLTAPVDIEFDASNLPIDANTYQILSYAWNFGDGSNGTGPMVSHRYTKKAAGDGRYTVSLDVTYMDLRTGEQFNGTFLTEVGIENELVAAAFTAKPQSGELPLNVVFDASASVDPDGEIVAYEWDLDGDGRFDDANGQRVEYEFVQEGTFDVTLRVTDNNGEFNTTTLSIEAGSVGGLRAIVDAPLGENEFYQVGNRYEFSGALSQIRDGNITKYTWDFGDGTVVQSRTVNHTYTKAGLYTVTLTVQDSNGNVDDGTLDLQVIDEGTPPNAKINTQPAASNGTVSGSVPFSLLFDASTSTDQEDDIVEFEWDFDGDGNVDETGDLITHVYEEAGTYLATLIVTDAAGNQSKETLTVLAGAQGLVPKLEVSTNNGEIPLTVEFDASASTYKEGQIVSYEYDFGDGSEIYIGGSTVTYRYNTVGTFNAKLTLVASDGTRKSVTTQIVVRPVALTACFTVNTDSGKSPLFLSVDPSCSQGTVSSYEWNFGDGEISFDRKPPVHTYTKPGTYTVVLEVTSDGGIVDTFEKKIIVN